MYAFTQSTDAWREVTKCQSDEYYKTYRDVFCTTLMTELLKKQDFIKHIASEITRHGHNAQFNLLDASQEEKDSSNGIITLDPHNKIDNDDLDALIVKDAKRVLKDLHEYYNQYETFESFYETNHEKKFAQKIRELNSKREIEKLISEPTWEEFFGSIIQYIKTLVYEWSSNKASEAFQNSDRGQKLQWQKFAKDSKLEENIKKVH